MSRRKTKRRRKVVLKVQMMGWLFLGVSLLVGLAAVRSHMPLMFVYFGAMLGAMAASSWLGRLMIGSIHVHRELPSRTWQFESLYFGYSLRNRRRIGCLGINLQEIAPEGIEDARGYCVHLPGKGAFRAGSRLAADRRGKVNLQGVRLWTEFPFGLVRVICDVDDPTELIVWPAKGRIKTDFLQHGAMEASTAQAGRHQGGQDEFFGLREYRQGDNPRWIHWRRSAGRPVPVVREMAHPVPEVLMLLLDVRLGGSGDNARQDRERMLRFAATLIDHALTRGYQVGLALAGSQQVNVIRPDTSVQTRTAMLDALAETTDTPCASLDDVADAVSQEMLGGAQVWVLAPAPDLLSPARRLQMQRTARHLGMLSTVDLDGVFDDHPLGNWTGWTVEGNPSQEVA